MTEQPDTAAIRAGIFGNPAKVIYDLCDALDAARTESEARRREQIYAVRLAEAAEAECERLSRSVDAVCVEALGYLDRAEAAEALGGKDAIRRRRAEANAETWRIAQASAAGMLLDVQRDCIAERQRAEAAEAECVRHATRSEELENALDAARAELMDQSDRRMDAKFYADPELLARAEAAEARINAALDILRRFGFTDTEMAIRALTEVPNV